MTTNKVKEVQEYLETKGFKVAETTIVDMAIALTRRLGAGDWTFACEAKMREEKEEMKKGKKLSFDDIPVHIQERVYFAIGEASMCWQNPEKAGVFESQKADKIGLTLCQFVLEEIEREKNEDPRLEERH